MKDELAALPDFVTLKSEKLIICPLGGYFIVSF